MAENRGLCFKNFVAVDRFPQSHHQSSRGFDLFLHLMVAAAILLFSMQDIPLRFVFSLRTVPYCFIYGHLQFSVAPSTGSRALILGRYSAKQQPLLRSRIWVIPSAHIMRYLTAERAPPSDDYTAATDLLSRPILHHVAIILRHA